MSTELARIPDRVLPAPSRGSLPEPVALRRMIGPSIILAGLSIGSGEFVPCLLSLAVFSLIAHELIGDGAVAGGLGFIADEAAALEARFGAGARNLFLGLGVAVLFTTELALLDAVSRVAADVLRMGVLGDRAPSLSRIG
jgi:hypothetical protein